MEVVVTYLVLNSFYWLDVLTMDSACFRVRLVGVNMAVPSRWGIWVSRDPFAASVVRHQLSLHCLI